ncbi:ribonuclease P protein subunit p40 isoform X4 [Lemur catta]|uniref:ribonuclease P protein subunit p40 isoform X4 n=1 Tax=Lemur catta TaxID=9447 RepID=UPI001E26AC8B|nr:ribonuclease P protein subunit p40 isoform X4 [Lemur catta]
MATLRRLRETPRHLLVCEKSNFGHDKSRHRHLVETHYHNYRVSFLIPECGILSKELKNLVMETGPYYFVKNLPLHELISQEFINTFVKKGSCCALTYNTNIDEDNAVALLPNGKLILSLDKDTYEECGLQGHPSQYSGRKIMKFIVSIDLMDLSFNLDSKKYERISWSFKEKKPLKFDFLLGWHHTGIEESVMMSYFSNYQIQEHQPKVSLSTVRDLQCPVLQSGELGGMPEVSCSALELFDWLGAVFSNASLQAQWWQKLICAQSLVSYFRKRYISSWNSSGTNQGYLLLPPLFNIVLKVLDCAVGQEIGIKDVQVRKKEVKLSIHRRHRLCGEFSGLYTLATGTIVSTCDI